MGSRGCTVRMLPMFVISKIVYHLFLPPGLLVVLLVVALVLSLMGKKRAFWGLFLFSLGLLYCFSIEPVHDFFLLPLENKYPPLTKEMNLDAGFVVVLGGGIIAGSPDEGGRGSPSRSALKRLMYGLRIADIHELPIIISGGGQYFIDKEYESEAGVASRLIAALGIEDSEIYTETRSSNTWENAANVSQIVHPNTIILVTSAFHMPRSILSFKKNGIPVIPAPTDYRINRRDYNYRSYLPSISSLEGVNAALKEYIGIIYYTLRR
jgi:uncharacterized SAM-binding protein YcdF (DUF218 family)